MPATKELICAVVNVTGIDEVLEGVNDTEAMVLVELRNSIVNVLVVEKSLPVIVIALFRSL